MRRRPYTTVLTILAGCLVMGACPIFADCVSCGPGAECFTASQGFSANCACVTRVVHGMTVCKPSGVCDPTDPNTCNDGGFPQGIASHPKISTRFLNDLAEANPLLAGAVWAGISEANSVPKNDRAEVKGTMGNKKKGKSYTYVAEVSLLPDGSASLTVHVEEDGAGRGMDFEGTVEANGRSGRFVQVGPKGRSPVYSWDAD